jgi:hypothetical protein
MSSAFMQADLMPGWIQTVARYNPVERATQAGREALTAAPGWGLVLSRPASRRPPPAALTPPPVVGAPVGRVAEAAGGCWRVSTAPGPPGEAGPLRPPE